MATSYGVTSWGFLRKPLSQIIEDAKSLVRATFGAGIDVSPEGPFGQHVADLSAGLDDVWQGLEAVYDSMDPDSAEGPRLVSLAGITGTVPVTPAKSIVSITATGTPGSAVPVGTQFQVAGQDAIFQTTAAAVIGAGGTVAIACESLDYGAFLAAAGTLTVILTPAAGLASVSNPLDAVPGIASETDPQFRLRREAELQAQGEGGLDSIRAALLRVLGVSGAIVFENTGDLVDANGLPPHSVECLVLGGADADIAKAVFTKGGGIYTHGTTVVDNVLDLAGQPHTMRFSRPTEKDVWVTVALTKDPTSYPVDGDAQVAQALVDFSLGQLAGLGNGYSVGDDVITAKLYAAIYSQVSGIVDVTQLWVGLANPPTGAANVVIGSRELAQFALARISVTST